jgi:hypothetical protein
VTETADIKREQPKTAKAKFKESAGLSDYKFKVSFEGYNNALIEVNQALKSDSLLRQATQRYIEVSLRQGFNLVYKDDKVKSAIEKRLNEIQLVSDSTLYEVLIKVFSDLIRYGNAYIVFRRNKDNASGKEYNFFNKKLSPISSMFVVDPMKMKIVVNKSGAVIGYKFDPTVDEHGKYLITSNGEEIEFKITSSQYITTSAVNLAKDDVLHLKLPNSYDYFGFPFYLETLEDLLMLRKIEEQIDDMLSQGMFNAVVYKVGNDKYPADSKDIQDVVDTLEYNPSEGVIIIPGKDEIKFLQSQNVTQLIDLMQYFKQRFYSGMGLSSVSMGEAGSANRATAEVSGNTMYEKVKLFQDIISNSFTRFFDHILRDQKFNTEQVNLSDLVSLKFPEPDLNFRCKLENAEIFKYQNNVQSLEEVRKGIGISEKMNWENSYFKKVTWPQVSFKVEQVQQKAGEANR